MSASVSSRDRRGPVPRMTVWILFSCVSQVYSHGMMQRPPSWQLGNIPLGGDAALPKPFFAPWPTACLAGACDWFVNSTRLSTKQTPTIAKDSVLRTMKDPSDDPHWSDRNPWRSPGAAIIDSPCGVEGGNPEGCIHLDGTKGECVTDSGGFGFGPDGRTLGGGYTYRVCRMPESGDYFELTEQCFQQEVLPFVGNTSFIEYIRNSSTSHTGDSNSPLRFEIDALRTAEGTTPPGSSWTKNPIPNVGTSELTPQGRDTWTNSVPQFPLPTLRGETVNTPTRLAGYISSPDWERTRPFGYNAGFDDWVLVDRVRVPAHLAPGQYVLSFRWDCEESAQVWLTCANVNIVDVNVSESTSARAVANGRANMSASAATASSAPPPAPAPVPAPMPAPLCGGQHRGCCLKFNITDPTGGTGGDSDSQRTSASGAITSTASTATTATCLLWSAAETPGNCILSKDHCENGTGSHGTGGAVYGCGGVWMPRGSGSGSGSRSDRGGARKGDWGSGGGSRVSPEDEKCEDAASQHVCGYGCGNISSSSSSSSSSSTGRRWCAGYYSVASGCTASDLACKETCAGTWLPLPQQQQSRPQPQALASQTKAMTTPSTDALAKARMQKRARADLPPQPPPPSPPSPSPSPSQADPHVVTVDFSHPVGPATSAIPTYLDDVNPGTMGRAAPLHDAVFEKIREFGADMVRYNHWDPFSLSYPEKRAPVIVPRWSASGTDPDTGTGSGSGSGSGSSTSTSSNISSTNSTPFMKLVLNNGFPDGQFNNDAANVTAETVCKQMCLSRQDCVGVTFVARPLSPCNMYTSMQADPKHAHHLAGCHTWVKVGGVPPTVHNQTFWNFTEADAYVVDFMAATAGHDSLISWTPLPGWLKTAEMAARPDYGALLGEYFSRIVGWYTKGGFVDEIGVWHPSPHRYAWKYWEVLNEVDNTLPGCNSLNKTNAQSLKCAAKYTELYDDIVLVMHRDHPELQFTALALAFPACPTEIGWFEFFLNGSNHKPEVQLAVGPAPTPALVGTSPDDELEGGQEDGQGGRLGRGGAGGSAGRAVVVVAPEYLSSISYHWYSENPTGVQRPTDYYMLKANPADVFAQTAQFLRQAGVIQELIADMGYASGSADDSGNWSSVAAAGSVKLGVNVNEIGILVPGNPTNFPGAATMYGRERWFWNLAAAQYVHTYGALARLGVRAMAASQLVSTIDWTHPLSMLDWTNADGSAWYWVVKMLVDALGGAATTKRAVSTVVDGVDAADAITPIQTRVCQCDMYPKDQVQAHVGAIYAQGIRVLSADSLHGSMGVRVGKGIGGQQQQRYQEHQRQPERQVVLLANTGNETLHVVVNVIRTDGGRDGGGGGGGGGNATLWLVDFEHGFRKTPYAQISTPATTTTTTTSSSGSRGGAGAAAPNAGAIYQFQLGGFASALLEVPGNFPIRGRAK